MRFRHHDHLRLFVDVAQHGSFSAAAEALNLSKGAIGYQMATLEESIGVGLFLRNRRGVVLTEAGTQLHRVASAHFAEIEREIELRRAPIAPRVVVGMSTYFASRWLSRRLMHFLQAHPTISLRIQPMLDLVDMHGDGVDVAIRWGTGDWTDKRIEPLFPCPAFATSAPDVADQVAEHGLEQVLTHVPLLADRDDSQAWAHWLKAANLSHLDVVHRDVNLVIPDPNVRVQAVIDGQGMALNDALVETELALGVLSKVSDITLPQYGYYLAFAEASRDLPAVVAFAEWIRLEVDRAALTD